MPLTGWVTQTIFIDCLKPNSTSSQEPKDETKENNQQCPKYLLSGSEDGTIKLWDLHDMGKIRFSLEQDAGISCMIQSNLKGKKLMYPFDLVGIQINYVTIYSVYMFNSILQDATTH